MGNWESRQSLPKQVCPCTIGWRWHLAEPQVIFSLGQKTSGSPSLEVPPTSCIVIDGTVVIQFLKPATEKASTSMHCRSLCPTYILKTSSRHVTGPGVGPLHNGPIKGYSKSQAKNGVRRRVVGSGTEPAFSELREQDPTVPQIQPLADIVHYKYIFTYLLTLLTRQRCSASSLASSTTHSSLQTQRWSSLEEMMS